MSDYLWDKTGEPDEDVEQLENLLGALKYQPRPLDIPASAMPTAKVRPASMFYTRPRLAIAASLLLTLLAGMWFVTRQDETQKNNIATVNNGSETISSKELNKEFAAKDENVNNSSGGTAVEPKPRKDSARIVVASSPKVHRAPRRLMAKRQKLQPRKGVEDALATRELLAANGTRWQFEKPLTPEQRAATEKLMLALQVASAKFNYAQREMQEIGRAGK